MKRSPLFRKREAAGKPRAISRFSRVKTRSRGEDESTRAVEIPREMQELRPLAGLDAFKERYARAAPLRPAHSSSDK